FSKILDYDVECKNCPENIALMVAYGENEISFCTAFLAEKNLIATNSHCIPDWIDKKKSLSEQIRFFFPKTGKFEKETISAEKIVLSFNTTESPSITKNDIAVISIAKKTKREPLKLDNSGFFENEKIILWSTELIKGQNRAKLIKKNCKVIYNSVLSPIGFSQNSPHVTIAGCEIKHGYSGSPIISSENRVKGILFGSVDRVKSVKLFKKYLTNPKNSGKMGVGLNFSCAIPQKFGKFPDECLIDPQKNYFWLISKTIENKIGNLKNIEVLKNGVYWKNSIFTSAFETKNQIKFESYISFLPKCIKHLPLFLSQWSEMGGLYKAYFDKSINIEKIKIKLNQFFQVEKILKTNKKAEGILIYFMDEKKWNNTKKGNKELLLNIGFWNFKEKRIESSMEMSIPFCR
ncbi:trypsin-like serine protease, partial [bacterium]|nr:trypsin-like serine protease [bacterium]